MSFYVMPVNASHPLVIYGLKSCDTCRNAQKWSRENNLEFQFLDIRVDGISTEQLQQWLATEFGPLLLNRRSTTWRQLSDIEKAKAQDNPKDILMEHPTLIKRPVITRNDELIAVGFNPRTFADTLKS
jgi:arsenate reductase